MPTEESGSGSFEDGEPAPVPRAAVDLIESLLCLDPKVRCGAHGSAEVRAAEFFGEVDWEETLDTKPPFVPQPEGLSESGGPISGGPQSMCESFGVEALSNDLFRGFSFKNLENLKELNMALAREHELELEKRKAFGPKKLNICTEKDNEREESREDLVSPTDQVDEMVNRWQEVDRSEDSLSSEDMLSPHSNRRPRSAQQSPPSLLGFSVNE